MHPEDLPRALEVFERVLRGETPPAHLVRIRTRSGEHRLPELTPTPLREGETVGGVLGIARDVTERERTQQMLRRSEKLATLGELLAGVPTS